MTVRLLLAAAALLFQAGAAGAEGRIEQSDLFAAGQGGYHTYRIPALAATRGGVLLAFCEGRKQGRGDAGDIDILLRRSADGGRTWGPVQVVVDDGPDTAGNPAPVVERTTGKVLLLFSKNQAAGDEDRIIRGEAPRTVWITHSADEGAAWAPPREITRDVKRPDWTWYATGPGHGIQLSSGRLVVPCDHSLGTGPTRDHAERGHSHLILSDDLGETWRIGGVVEKGTNESTVVEAAGGLYVNCRNYIGGRRRAYAWSRDQGLTFEERRWDDSLPEPVCQASLLRLTEPGAGRRGRILFSNPAAERRERLTVRLSYDECATWTPGRALHAGPAAYSDLARTGDGSILCLYERGERHYSERITLARFDLEWLSEGKDRLETESAAAPEPASSPPNILWITAEDLSPDLGCYGDVEARTPHLDRLASQGARFTRAFAVAGVCAPSRSAIITGMYPTSIGTHHMRCQGVPPPHVKCFTEYLRAAGYHCSNNAKTDYNFEAPLTAWDENGPRAGWRGRRPGQPFFAVINLTMTHESQIRAGEEQFARQTARLGPADRHDPRRAVVPPYYPDTPRVRRDWARYQDLVTAMDLRGGEILRELEEDGLAERTIVFFLGDHGRGLPRAKRWVYDAGIRVPLIVRWPGVIEPGTAREELVSLIDLAPTVLSVAGLAVPPHLQGQAFLGARRPPPRRHIFAHRDRMDEAYDIIRCARDERWKYIRNLDPRKPYAQFIHYMEEMPTMQEMRLLHKLGKLEGPERLFFLPEKPPEELYDTQADPHEVRDLSASPEHRETLERLRGALDRWMAETGDLGLVPEETLKERQRPGGRWAETAAPVAEPAGGSFAAPVAVKLRSATEGASIAYSTDEGERPRWSLYHREIRLERSATLRARACRLGFKDSPELAVSFRFEPSGGAGVQD